MAGDEAGSTARIRLDKWLWHARFYKTRSLATREVQAGHARVNGQRVEKPATPVAPGDVLTLRLSEQVRVVRVLACGERRGPAVEAQTLYADLTPASDPSAPVIEQGGRPTKKDRRTFELSRRPPLE